MKVKIIHNKVKVSSTYGDNLLFERPSTIFMGSVDIDFESVLRGQCCLNYQEGV